jgi:septal ring factor EnvC (AmiA/AmiB activator)
MECGEFGQGAAVISFPQAPEARLRVALRQLDAALAEQRAAVAAFRRELAKLGGALSGLEVSTAELKARLAEAADDTDRAGKAARRLVATGEAMDRLI